MRNVLGALKAWNAETHFAPSALNTFGCVIQERRFACSQAIHFAIWRFRIEPFLTGGLTPRLYHSRFVLHLILRGAIAAGDTGLVSSFFNCSSHRFADAFVED